MSRLSIFCFTLFLHSHLLMAQIPAECRQLIIGISSGWNSSHVTLSLYERTSKGWKAQGPAWPGRLGRNGMAWGRGVHPNQPGRHKLEGDGKAPAGLFGIGGAYGYASKIQRQADLTYRTVTERDLWVEDSKSSYYNRHIILPHDPKTSWEKQQQMRQGDPAHALKLYIAHNHATKNSPAIPNAGSAIFFHIWRQSGAKATSGCTTMEETKLKRLIAWIKPTSHPHYLLLTKQEYAKLQQSWKLP